MKTQINKKISARATKVIIKIQLHLRKNSSSFLFFNFEPHTKITFLQKKLLSNDKKKNDLLKVVKAFRIKGYTIKLKKMSVY